MTRTPYFTPEQRRKLESQFSELSEEATTAGEEIQEYDEDVLQYNEAAAAHLVWVLCQKAEARSLDIRKIFRSFDNNLDGLLEYVELKQANS